MFLNPLGLLALLGVPAVIALHLFRRRFERRRVSALFLWEARTITTLSGRRREKLLRSPSFWAELLAALLLGLSFAGPRGCGSLEAKHLVVVLDGSASMSALPPGEAGRSFADEVRERLDAQIEDLSGGSRVTIVESGPRPRIAVGPAAFPEEARSRLDEYRPAAGAHDLAPAVALALQLAGAGAVTLYTDRFEPDRFPGQVGVVAVGRPLDNLAITRATRLLGSEAEPEGERVLVTVTNFSPRERPVTVALLAGGVPLAAEELPIEAGARRHFTFDLPPDTPPVEAVLEGGDAFELDDLARLVPPPRRTLALASTLDGQELRFLGLASASAPLDRWTALVPRSTAASSPEVAHLAIAREPVGGPETWCLVLAPPAGEALDLLGPFLLEKRHPLLSGVTLDGVVWSAASEVALPGVPLVSAGDRPLLTEEHLGERRIFHANVDFQRSSLQLSPDWPILLDNLAELRRRELAGAESVNLSLGEAFRYRADATKPSPSEAGRDAEPETRNASDPYDEYVLHGPVGDRELRARGELVIEDLTAVGAYRLADAGGATLAELAVNFGDDRESDLRALDSGERASSVELAEERAGSSWLILLLAVGALGAVLFDWGVLRPRGRVESPGGRG